MINIKLFELMATLGLDTGDFDKGVNNSYSKAESLASKVGSFMSNTAATVGKGLAIGAGALASGFAAATKQAFDLYGPLEQNLGGAVAVFGEYADAIQTKAAHAAQNMGSSMTDYLAAINQMGSLAQGAGFSMGEAAEMSAEAMQRAADVASIMGLSSERAMESVAGMFKGNFTMMDNLGVAINDAALAEYALSQGIEKSTQKMSTQEKVALAYGLFMERTAKYAGNYRKENETLSGSIEVLHAAWDNFLLGTEDSAEILIDSLFNAGTAAFTAVKEITPRLWNNFTEAARIAIPKIETAWVNLWDNKLPTLATNGANLVIDGMNAVFGTNIPHIDKIDLPKWEQMKKGVVDWWATVSTGIDGVATWTLQLFGVPDEDVSVIKEIVGDWWNGVRDEAESVLEWLIGDPDLPDSNGVIGAIGSWWSGVLSGIGGALNLPVEVTQENKDRVGGYAYQTREHGYSDEGHWLTNIFTGLNDLFTGSDADGLAYVPYDDYRTRLHRGEAVLPRQEAEAYRAGQTAGGADTQAILEKLDDVVTAISNMSVNMDGRRVGDIVTETVSRNIASEALSIFRYG